MHTHDLKAEKKDIIQKAFRDLEAVYDEEGYARHFWRLLSRVGLDKGDLELGTPHLTFEKYSSGIQSLCDIYPIPALGVRLGHRKNSKTLGVFGVGMMTSPSLAHTFSFAPRFMDLMWDHSINFKLLVEDDWAITRYELSLGSAFALVAIEEAIMTSIRIVSEAQPDLDWTSCEIRMRRPPSDKNLHRDLFPCACLYNQAADELRFPAQWLDLPPILSNANVSSYCESFCMELHDGTERFPQLSRGVQHFLQTLDAHRCPSLSEVASNLGMTDRSFRRRLMAEGTSFRDLVNSWKQSKAEHYLLETQMPIKEIAFRLGFSHLSSFYRAFGQGAGLTPEQVRMTQKEGR